MHKYPEGILFLKGYDRDDAAICFDIDNAVELAEINGDVRLSQSERELGPHFPDLSAQAALLAAGVEVEFPEPVQGISLKRRLIVPHRYSPLFIRNDELKIILEMLAEAEDRAPMEKSGLDIPTESIPSTIAALSAMSIEAT